MLNPSSVIEVPGGEPVIAVNNTNPVGGTATRLAVLLYIGVKRFRRGLHGEGNEE